MTLTAQEIALRQAQRLYGKESFTEDHLHFRRIGVKRGDDTFSAIGDTWEDALHRLARKVK